MKLPRAIKASMSFAIAIVAVLGLYNASAAYVLRFHLDSVLFPRVVGSTGSIGPVIAHLTDASGSELILHRYSEPRTGCAIFFPGQHGELSSYQQTLFRKLADAGVAVFAVDYPGQDGAAGSPNIPKLLDLSRRAVLLVTQQCTQRRTVIVGRSLGSMVAVYAAEGVKPAAIVLDSAAPSLSAAITTRIRSSWYLYPLTLLPVHALLAHDYSLAEALAHTQDTRVVVFQGTADRRTPIRDLEQIGALPANVRLVPISRATHADMYQLALDAEIGAVIEALPHLQDNLTPVAR
jgi:acetyl esterase/lipase